MLVPAAPSFAAERRAGPATGMYACVTYNSGTGLLETKSNLKISPRGKYQYARFARGTRLVEPKPGTYSATARKVVFKTGPMKTRYGKLSRTGSTPTISVFTKKPDRDTAIDCYRQ